MRTKLFLSLLLLSITVANSQTTIQGRILGGNGKPLPMAHVHLIESFSKPPLKSVTASREGNYSIELPSAGIYTLEFTGVGHLALVHSSIADTDGVIQLDARLGTYDVEYSEAPHLAGELGVIGDFNGFAFDGAIPMKRQTNGLYVAEVPTTKGSLSYQIVGFIENRSVNGTLADRFEYDGGGDYRSIIETTGGIARIVFDPKSFPAGHRRNLSVLNPGDPAARTTATRLRLSRTIFERLGRPEDHWRKVMMSGGDEDQFRYDWSADLELVEHAIDTAHEALDRRFLLLDYLAWLTRVSYTTLSYPAPRSKYAAMFQSHVDPSAPVWALYRDGLQMVPTLLGRADGARYLLRLAAEHTDAETRVTAIAYLLVHLPSELDAATRKRLHAQVTIDLAATETGQRMKETLGPWDRERLPTTAPARLTGTVVDKRGNGIAGAQVTIQSVYGRERLVESAETGGDGSFALSTIQHNQVRMSVWLNGVELGRSEFLLDGPVDGRLRIVTHDRDATIDVEDARSTLGTVLYLDRLSKEPGRLRREAYMKHVADGGDRDDFKYSADFSQRLDSLATALEKSTDPAVRRAMVRAYLETLMGTSQRLRVTNDSTARGRDNKIARVAFDEISPASPYWNDDNNIVALQIAADWQADQARMLDYMTAISDEHPQRWTRASMLYRIASMSEHARSDDSLVWAVAKRAYETLGSGYGDMEFVKERLRELSPDRPIQVGKPVPSFSFASIDDPTRIYTRESMLGKFYLIDFWATWCGPCIGEMKSLHSAFDKFKGRGLEIISVSLDGAPADVKKFIEGNWKMPWHHSFARGGFGSEAAKMFEFNGIPFAVLVGRDGTILDVDNLRGAALERTIERALSNQ